MGVFLDEDSLLDVAVGFIDYNKLVVFDSLQLPLSDSLVTLFAVLFGELGVFRLKINIWNKGNQALVKGTLDSFV